jgi:ABC-type multidrug transport system fused ATPase/permease subunit
MSDAPPKAGQDSSLKIYFRLLGYVKPYTGLFLLSIVGFVIFASTQPMLAGILKYFVDGLSNPEAVLLVRSIRHSGFSWQNVKNSWSLIFSKREPRWRISGWDSVTIAAGLMRSPPFWFV